MTPVHIAAAQRALALLNAAGCPYAVIIDGEKRGTLEVQPERKRNHDKPRGWLAEATGYIDKVDAAKPGDALEFRTKDYALAVSLQKALSSRLGSRFGSGNYLTTMSTSAKGDFLIEALVLDAARLI